LANEQSEITILQESQYPTIFENEQWDMHGFQQINSLDGYKINIDEPGVIEWELPIVGNLVDPSTGIRLEPGEN